MHPFRGCSVAKSEKVWRSSNFDTWNRIKPKSDSDLDWVSSRLADPAGWEKAALLSLESLDTELELVESLQQLPAYLSYFREHVNTEMGSVIQGGEFLYFYYSFFVYIMD